ncbi:MAG: SPOR domain-containing protein [Sulfuritalea sp.]|nr:SPOR domain-containing protein [Polynucleobacter sp.]MCF8189189.1 SPOR domain-containing protein [Sulfuritalea sp.]
MDRNPDMAELIGAEGIFLRTADRRRFDYVLRGVREESLSLSLSSDNDGLLDHYGRLLINKLRKSDGLHVEVFLPQNTEALLDRFNQILADISIDEARNAQTSQAPRRVLLAHDAKAISERDMQLMSRLVQDFPGAHVSVVLLVDKIGTQMHEKNLEKFGQRLMRWPLETPSREEGETLLEMARAAGYEVEVKKVLATTGYSKPVKPVAVVAAAAAAAEIPEEKNVISAGELAAMRQKALKGPVERTEPSMDIVIDVPVPETTSTPVTETLTDAVTKPRIKVPVSLIARWVAALFLVLLVALTVIIMVFPQRMGPMLYNSPVLKAQLPEWAMNAVVSFTGKPPTAQLEESKAAAKENSASVPAPQTDITDNKSASEKPAAIVESAPKIDIKPAEIPVKTEIKPDVMADKTIPKAEVKAEAKVEAKTEPVVSAPATKPEPVIAPAAPVSSSPAEALAPRSERGADNAVRQARPGSYFVQHVSLNSMAEAQEWRAQYAALNKSRIAAVKTTDKGVKYVVLSGPFPTQKDAEAFSARPGVPADPWVRPLKSLQRALVSSR